MIPRHTALAATALLVATLATPVALAGSHDALFETEVAAVGGGDQGVPDSCDVALTWVEYAHGGDDGERFETSIGEDNFTVDGDKYYLCVGTNPDSLDDVGLWKETNFYAGLQTEPVTGLTDEPDTYCGPSANLVLSDAVEVCPASPDAGTPVQLP